MHPHILLFIQDLAIIMLIAGVMTFICRALKQPIVFGYILAGMIIGPFTPPFSLISDEVTINTLAELGLIFLMFSLGLEFNLRKLSKVGIAAFIAAFAEIVLMIWIGYEIGLFFHWSHLNAIFLGALLSISSTTIIIKALDELGLKKENFAQLIFGILILEDIFAILILALLSSIAVTGSLQITQVFITSTKLATFLVVSLLLGILFIPRLLTYIAKFNSNEMLLISVLGLCFGFCLLVIKLHYSIALGAFIIGAIIAESKQHDNIEYLILPLRDMFSAIFFVSVGLLFNPHVLIDYFYPIGVITIALIIGKVLTCSFGILITGRSGRTALRVGMGLAQIGEFSFIIAALGIALNVTSDFLYSIAVAVSVITTLLTPYLIKYSDSFTYHAKKIIPAKITEIFNLYSRWIQNIHLEKNHAEISKIIKLSLIQITINLFIVIAIFLSCAYIPETPFGQIVLQEPDIYMQKILVWCLALVLSLPFLMAVYRKIKMLSKILAKASIKTNTDFSVAVGNIIAELIPITSIIAITIFITALSTSILPPLELLIIILIIVAILTVLLGSWFIKFHSRLQKSLLAALHKDDKKKGG